jgi:predicted nucleotidyltransferase component of viral defense system
MTANHFSEQVRLLMELLPHVAEHPCFALKGGTAINFFVRDLPRLSVDIDLAYLPVEDREASLAAIDRELAAMQAAVGQKVPGVSVEPGRVRGTDKRIKLLARRGGALVKVEVTPVLRGSVHPAETREATPRVQEQFGPAAAQTLGFDDLYGGKLVAALDRQHPRDLFDVGLLLRNEGISARLKDTFLVYLLGHNRPMAELLAPAQHLLEESFLNEFAGMTDEPVGVEELTEVRKRLVETIHAALTNADREFLLSVKRGEPDWEAFPYPQARDLPAIRWKLHNLEQMSPQKRAEATRKLEAALHG